MNAFKAVCDKGEADGGADDAVRAAHRHAEERGQQEQHGAPDERRRVASREQVWLFVVDGHVNNLFPNRIRHLCPFVHRLQPVFSVVTETLHVNSNCALLKWRTRFSYVLITVY